MPRGGPRPGSGRPLGRKNDATISKEEAREAHRLVVMEHFREMTEAQIAHAKGLKYLVLRNKATGKFEKITSERMDQLLCDDKDSALEAIEVWEKDPSVQAYTDLMNRAMDKPAEQEQAHTISGALVIKWEDG